MKHVRPAARPCCPDRRWRCGSATPPCLWQQSGGVPSSSSAIVPGVRWPGAAVGRPGSTGSRRWRPAGGRGWPDGAPTRGYVALVVPVPLRWQAGRHLSRSAGPLGGRARAPRLRHWGGEGAVRLLRADPRRARAPARAPAAGTCGVLGRPGDAGGSVRLCGRLRPGPAAWRRSFVLRAALVCPGWPRCPRRLPVDACERGRRARPRPGRRRPGPTGRWVHADLHCGRCCAGGRGPGSPSSPKPLGGDRTGGAVLWNQ